MKNIFLNFFVLAALCLTGIWSCEKALNFPNPNMPDGTINPSFGTDIRTDTIKTEKEGGVYTINVDQNTKYKWIASSNQTWATLDVAATDTLQGDKSLSLQVAAYEAVDARVATITLKEVAPKANRTITIRVIQAGAEPTVNVDKTTIATEALGGSYPVVVSTNGGTWTATSDAGWLSVSPTTGKNVTAEITVTKNVNPNTPNRTGTITFTSGVATKTVTVTQTGFTTCNEPNNTATIYFDEFAPCEDSKVGDVWNLTDRRDGKVYKVKLMADGRYWMIEDLRFGGTTDVVDTKKTFSTDNPANAGTLGEYIPGLYGDMVNITFNGSSDINPPRAGRGYFYNWRAAMQQADISTGAAYKETQGIAPAGWHIPSVDEFKALRDKIGINGVAWGEDANSIWKGIWGGDIDAGTRRNWGLAGYGYYWTSTNFMTGTGASAVMGVHQAVVWKINNPSNETTNVNIYLEAGNGLGVAEPAKKNKNGGALIRCIRNY
ncbi:MAG: FISUMP domain-containing protein [Niabella sp.]